MRRMTEAVVVIGVNLVLAVLSGFDPAALTAAAGIVSAWLMVR